LWAFSSKDLTHGDVESWFSREEVVVGIVYWDKPQHPAAPTISFFCALSLVSELIDTENSFDIFPRYKIKVFGATFLFLKIWKTYLF
jgi:hypothetical protein